MDKTKGTQQLEAALIKYLKQYRKESGSPVAVTSNWEQGQILIQVGGK
ncbi:hypothetical protein RYX45_01335 [Alkalihalophilus pseudofirmus]|uniref:Uncharacterized protein n=1 Tax=Alkalihalophilus pseudofirmus TaxID=79885 RepID=A0AAJ2NMJ6_ALKPS|nr:hypothetical protein [Alkalihalophilus pseudofirmus]MDV2883805.1 hypothetical protein [Alkalihalophilus pseudofirmus]